MSNRKQPKPIYAFHRFLEGIFSYYYDRGMPKQTAKVRMFKEVYDTCYDFAKKEEDAPDHALVATMQHASRHLNQRGYALSKKLEDNPESKIREELHHIKIAKESIDNFIETYRGESHV
jgi:hypothetical protein